MKGTKYIVASLLATCLAVVLRVSAVITKGNLAIVFEAFHAGIDVIITLMVLISIIIMESKISERFPYGLYKLEDLVTLIIVIVMIFSGIDLLVSGLRGGPSSVDVVQATAQLLSLIPLQISVFTRSKAAQVTRSPALRADALHCQVDVLEGLGVALGLFWSIMSGQSIAYTIALAIAALGFFLAAFEVSREAILAILDIPKDKTLCDRIAELSRSVDGVTKVTSVKARWAGPVLFVEVVLEVNAAMTVEEAHIISNRIEELVKSRIEGVRGVIVHIEPSVRKELLVALPMCGSNVCRQFAKAEKFLLVKVKDDDVISKEMFSVGCYVEKMLLGAEISEKLVEMGVTDVILFNIGEIAFSILLRHDVFIWRARTDDPDENIRLLIERKLVRIKEPTKEASWRAFSGG